MAKRGLGKGLDILIGSAAATEGHRLEEIPIKDIIPNPRQPRQRFDKEAIGQMAQSIRAFGVVQPIIVRPVGTEYELVAGERRWRASKEAGLEKIPAVVRESTETDALEMALIENLHRDDLNGIEEAAAYLQLLDDFGITHEELSQKVGRSRAAITNTLRLLQLPASIQKAVMDEKISTGHARALLALQDAPEAQERLARRIIKEGLSVREVEEIARESKGDVLKTRKREKRPLPGDVQEMFRKIEELLEARVTGTIGKRKGRLVIEFTGLEDLGRIFSLMATGNPAYTEDNPSPGADTTDG